MKPIYFVPIMFFVVVAVALGVGLTLNPREIPSVLIGEPVPKFDMAPLYPGEPRFSDEVLRDGKTKLVNVFGSWCVPCRAEHPMLMQLQDEGIPIYAINQRDDPADADKFLKELGNPYTLIGRDPDMRVSIDWGVYGVPETFVVGGDGTILFKHIGPMTRESVRKDILPHFEDEK